MARVLAVLLLIGSAAAQNVVHYTTTTANVKYLFATAEPVLRLKSGDIIDTNTLDCFGTALRSQGTRSAWRRETIRWRGRFMWREQSRGTRWR